MPPEGYLRRARELCDANRVLLIADEIQSGLGRTGRTFACEHEGVQPDVFVLGKALGGGIVPISAVVSTREVLGVFRPGEHGSTFGGNPLACAIGIEVLRLLRTGEYQRRSDELGTVLIERLRAEAPPAAVSEIRGKGLWVGIELTPEAAPAREVCERLLEMGVLAKDTHETTVRLAPPLCVTAGGPRVGDGADPHGPGRAGRLTGEGASEPGPASRLLGRPARSSRSSRRGRAGSRPCGRVRVVEDVPHQHRAFYLAPGSRFLRDPRDPGEVRFSDRAWRLERRERDRPVLSFAFPETPYAVLLSWSVEWRFEGYYVNIQSPLRERDGVLEYTDWFLDVRIPAEPHLVHVEGRGRTRRGGRARAAQRCRGRRRPLGGGTSDRAGAVARATLRRGLVLVASRPGVGASRGTVRRRLSPRAHPTPPSEAA